MLLKNKTINRDFEMKFRKTMWKELQYANVKATCVGEFGRMTHKESFWSFFNEGKRVGPIYKTKDLLLSDMKRYAKENWGLE